MNLPASYNAGFTLPPGGRLLMPFTPEAFIESLPVYCGSYPQALNLRYLTRFIGEDYYMGIRACPSTQQSGASNVIASNQGYEDQLSIPAGSFLTAIAGHTNQTDAGFRVYIYDAGAQEDVVDNFINSVVLSGQFLPNPVTGITNSWFIDGAAAVTNALFNGLFILPSPLSIASPGQLNIRIVNLSANTATIDMAFFFACPASHLQQTGAAAVSNTVKR